MLSDPSLSLKVINLLLINFLFCVLSIFRFYMDCKEIPYAGDISLDKEAAIKLWNVSKPTFCL